jgi:hypothetical protein
MNTDLDVYRRDLLAELRIRGVPAQRIAEAIAEVESHVAETGEQPRVAFGDPRTYAAELAQSLGCMPQSFTGRVQGTLVAITAFAGAALMTRGITTGVREHVWTRSVILPIAAGVVLLGVALFGGARAGRGLTDPRTGKGLRVPASRWALPIAAAVIAAALAVVLALGWPGLH